GLAGGDGRGVRGRTAGGGRLRKRAAGDRAAGDGRFAAGRGDPVGPDRRDPRHREHAPVRGRRPDRRRRAAGGRDRGRSGARRRPDGDRLRLHRERRAHDGGGGDQRGQVVGRPTARHGATVGTGPVHLISVGSVGGGRRAAVGGYASAGTLAAPGGGRRLFDRHPHGAGRD